MECSGLGFTTSAATRGEEFCQCLPHTKMAFSIKNIALGACELFHRPCSSRATLHFFCSPFSHYFKTKECFYTIRSFLLHFPRPTRLNSPNASSFREKLAESSSGRNWKKPSLSESWFFHLPSEKRMNTNDGGSKPGKKAQNLYNT